MKIKKRIKKYLESIDKPYWQITKKEANEKNKNS